MLKCAYSSFVIVPWFASFAAIPASAQTLLHNYTFTSGVTDSVGNANGTLTGGSNVSGGTLNLDGATGYAQFGSKIVPTSGSYSISLFAQQPTRQNNFIEMISQGFSGGPGFYIGHDPSGIIRSGDSWINTGVAFPQDGQWHHYALTVDSSAAKSQLYIDGAVSATLNSAITSTPSGSDTRFGRQFAPDDEFFKGSMDNVSIYSGALSASQVKQLASVPSPSALLTALIGIVPGMMLLRRRRK